jgi:NhaA family Na+:H+ antiporter
MPIFALANAGVYLGGDAFRELGSPISLGIICGLVLGKPIGIAAFAWLAVQTRLAVLPTGVNWRQILGAGMLGGIGFTMSLFIASLAFASNTEIETSKIGILAASIVSALAGTLIVFKRNLPNDGKDAESAIPAGQESVN